MLTPSKYAKILAIEEAFHSLPSPSVLVDAGCGDGLHISQIKAVRKIGLDLIPPKLNRDIECIKCDIRSIPLKDGCCDCLLSLDVIEHIKGEDKVVTEFYRILGCNGKLTLTTPNDSQFMPYRTLEAMFSLDTAKMHRVWQHVKPGYSRNELVTLVEQHGFEVIYHHSFCQPLVRVLELVYLLPMMVSEHIYSPEERARRLRSGKIIKRLETAHDFLFSLLLAPIIKKMEKGGDNGFLHLLVSQKTKKE